MGEEGNATNLAASKLCDSCKSATASLFCRNDSAFLCIPCDSKIHAANKVASRHARVLMCEVCQRAPAHVTCKVDAAALCVACDRDIHSANPLACRHERFPVVPFYDSVVRVSNYHQNYLNACEAADEEEAASWLMPNLNAKIDDPDRNQPHVNFTIYAGVDPYRDLDIGPKECLNEAQISSVADGVVPEHCKNGDARVFLGNGGVADDCFDVGLTEPYKGFPYFGAANGNSINHIVSSSSHEVGVVPDSVSNTFGGQSNSVLVEVTAQAVPLFGAEREAKVLRYQEKRKNRKFEKTIRYASRKAYAETRPRIKGRFAKRTENDAAAVDDQIYDMDSPAVRNSAAGYLVPTY